MLRSAGTASHTGDRTLEPFIAGPTRLARSRPRTSLRSLLRRFDVVVTYDRDRELLLTAARALMACIAPEAPPLD